MAHLYLLPSLLPDCVLCSSKIPPSFTLFYSGLVERTLRHSLLSTRKLLGFLLSPSSFLLFFLLYNFRFSTRIVSIYSCQNTITLNVSVEDNHYSPLSRYKYLNLLFSPASFLLFFLPYNLLIPQSQS